MTRALLPATLGGLLAMGSFYFHSPQLPKLLILGLLGGLGGGSLVYLLSPPAWEPPESLNAALRAGGLQGGLAGLWGGLSAWLLLCLWNGPGTWLGLTPLP
ncbi:MAG: hypothetical protein KF760_05440 [Candidatus Eremiobacteraeota bacterium]|nr:hypothetical protein [Candidatus Eremiobacteraeota bacterium]MCW5867737.1 hypothetical protein [Candidatus Eremiobacteraeota bacterium]